MTHESNPLERLGAALTTHVSSVKTSISPFKLSGLSVLTYANGYTHWHYKADVPMVETTMPGFFRHAFDLMRDQDTMLISAPDATSFAVLTGQTGGTCQAVLAWTVRTPRVAA